MSKLQDMPRATSLLERREAATQPHGAVHPFDVSQVLGTTIVHSQECKMIFFQRGLVGESDILMLRQAAFSVKMKRPFQSVMGGYTSLNTARNLLRLCKKTLRLEFVQ